jgi:hypothetical protein
MPGYVPANREYNKQRHYLRLHWVPYNVPMADACKQLCENLSFKIIWTRCETSTEEGFESVRTGVRVITLETDIAFLIPHFINWSYGGARSKALITMKGRPMVCLRCKMEGHRQKDCKEEQCKKCFRYGHNAEDCQTPSPSFADVLSGKKNDDSMEFEGYDEPVLEQTEETVLKLSETIVKQETGKTVSFSIQIEKQPRDIKETQEEAIKPTSELKENEEASKGISEDTLEAVPLNLSLETKAVKTQIRTQDSDVKPDSETEIEESDRKNIDMQGPPCLVIKGPQIARKVMPIHQIFLLHSGEKTKRKPLIGTKKRVRRYAKCLRKQEID